MTISGDSRAVWFTSPRRAELIAEPVRKPLPNEVTIRTVASLISRGTEIAYYRGEVDVSVDIGLPTIETKGTSGFPIKFGYECVGTVIEAGVDAPHRVGDTVFARHPHQELFTVAVEHEGRQLVVAVPPTMDPEAATFTNLVGVALNVLLDIPIHIGDVVVVFGQGVVGMLIAQLARRIAGRVIVVDPISLRRKLSQSFGADQAVPPEGVTEAVRAAGGHGADVVIEASGSASALQSSLQIAAPEATVVVVSSYGRRPVELTLMPWFHQGRLRVISSVVGRINPAVTPRWDPRRRTATALDVLPSLHAERMVTHRFPLQEAAQAFRLADQHPDEALGIVLTYP